jgi:Asp/Glu/hydantoin racemase
MFAKQCWWITGASSGIGEALARALAEAGRKAIEEDGADVLLLGSTTMHQAHAYLAERLPVPVINPGPLVPKPELFEAMLAAAAASELRKK